MSMRGYVHVLGTWRIVLVHECLESHFMFLQLFRVPISSLYLLLWPPKKGGDNDGHKLSWGNKSANAVPVFDVVVGSFQRAQLH